MAGKVSKQSVDYRKAARGAAKRCGTCDMFRPTAGRKGVGECTLVAGVIGQEMVCDRWDGKK